MDYILNGYRLNIIFATDRTISSYETFNGRANNNGTIIPMVFNVEAINLLDFDINII